MVKNLCTFIFILLSFESNSESNFKKNMGRIKYFNGMYLDLEVIFQNKFTNDTINAAFFDSKKLNDILPIKTKKVIIDIANEFLGNKDKLINPDVFYIGGVYNNCYLFFINKTSLDGSFSKYIILISVDSSFEIKSASIVSESNYDFYTTTYIAIMQDKNIVNIKRLKYHNYSINNEVKFMEKFFMVRIRPYKLVLKENGVIRRKYMFYKPYL